MDTYNKYLLGKRVVIVGPASSIVGTKQGPYINSYDVIVRINDALPVPEDLKEDVGTRCDVLYSNMNDKPTPYSKYRTINNKDELKKLQWVSTPVPLEMPETRINIGHGGLSAQKYLASQKVFCQRFQARVPEVPFHITDGKLFAEFVDAIGGGRPNTGLAAIRDLLNFALEELYITGFTFFKGGYYKQYDNMPLSEEQVLKETPVDFDSGLHQINPQKRYFRELLLRDDRIRIDDDLREALV